MKRLGLILGLAVVVLGPARLFGQTEATGVAEQTGVAEAIPIGGGVTVPTPDFYYSFDNDGGTGSAVTADIGDNCALTGSPAWVSDDAGGSALDFSGATQMAVCGSAHDGLNDFALAACIQADGYGSSSALGHIVNKSAGASNTTSWGLRMNDFTGTIDRFEVLIANDAAGEDRLSAPNDSMDPYVGTATWVHVAAVVSGCSGMNCAAQLYLNGSPVTTTPTNDVTGTRRSDASDNLRIGAINSTASISVFDGRIDDVKGWYTDIPDASEIAADAAPCAARN